MNFFKGEIYFQNRFLSNQNGIMNAFKIKIINFFNPKVIKEKINSIVVCYINDNKILVEDRVN